MARFLIEVTHEAERVDCARVVEVLLKTGSDFLMRADWGCMGDEHKAWIIADLDSKEEASSILPPTLRSQAKIVQLSYFTLEEVRAMLGNRRVSQPQS